MHTQCRFARAAARISKNSVFCWTCCRPWIGRETCRVFIKMRELVCCKLCVVSDHLCDVLRLSDLQSGSTRAGSGWRMAKECWLVKELRAGEDVGCRAKEERTGNKWNHK